MFNPTRRENLKNLVGDRKLILQVLQQLEDARGDQLILNPPHEPYTDLLLSSAPEMDPSWLPKVMEHRRELAAKGVNLQT